MDVQMIATVTFTSPDRVRDVIRNFSADGFYSLKPRNAGGRPPKFSLARRTRAEIKKVAQARPVDHGLPFSTWSLSKLADFLVAEGGRRHFPRGPADTAAPGERLLSKPSGRGRPAPPLTTRPRRNRVLELYVIAHGRARVTRP
jgi:hypothetical protein